MRSAEREVLRHYVRLPREPGRFARLRGGAARERSSLGRAGPGRCRHCQHLLGDGECRSRGAPDRSTARSHESGARKSSSPVATRPVDPRNFGDAPNVLRVVPNDEKSRLVALLTTDFGLTTAQRFGDGDGSCGAAIEPGVAGRTAFTLRVQTGCAQPCSYCIIPATRGQPRSLPIAEVLSQVGRVAGAGFKEIAITGVHLGSYGRDLTPVSSLVDLLRALGADLQGVPRRSFGFASARSSRWTARARSSTWLRDGESFAPHFHLPLQHASERMLAAMRRPYTIEKYAALVDAIRGRMPAASIGSDIIVGFPGERDEDFEELCVYLGQSPLTHLHVFPYSDRPGTEASSMSGKVPGGIDSRARGAGPRHRPSADDRLSSGAARDHPSSPDDRRRLGRGDRQLSEGANSAGLRPERMGDGEDHRAGESMGGEV